MKTIIAMLAIVLSANAMAKGAAVNPSFGDSASASSIPPCWIQVSMRATVDGRRVTGFSRYQDTVYVFVGSMSSYNAVDVTVDSKDQDKYIKSIQAKIENCYK
jgi:hypothetical protein